MKEKKLLICLLLCFIVTSCIKDEAPNAEADILECIVPGDILKRDPQIENERVILMPKMDADITNLALEFTLTPGATINPPSGTPRDFSTPQTYIVTSEDSKWEKTYTIFCTVTELQTKYSFEHVELVGGSKLSYYKFYEVIDGNKQNIWASGNAALMIILGSKGPDAFPTTSYESGVSGKCAKLETLSTGIFGSTLEMPLAAGNLFIGEFNEAIAVGAPLQATRFGTPFSQEPISLTGYYKYKAGENYQDENKNIIPNKKDNFDIYAILYETDEDVKYLDGTNALTSPNLISVAQIQDEDKVETDEWTYFNIPFKLKSGKVIETDKLLASRYNISLVFTSSIDGALFRGALGSTLLIDEVEIHCKTID